MIRKIAQQLRQVHTTARLKIGLHLVQHICWHGRGSRQFRIGLAGAADCDQVPTLALRMAHQIGETGHAAETPQHAQHDDARASQLMCQQIRHLRIVFERLQINPADLREACGYLRQRAVQHG